MKKCYFSKRIPKETLSSDVINELRSVFFTFNVMKRTAYQSQIRDMRSEEPVSHEESLHVRMKKKFGWNDYYTNSAVQEANAMINSGKELNKLYLELTNEKIKKLKKKLKVTKTKKTKLQTIKASLKEGNLRFPKKSAWKKNKNLIVRPHRGKIKKGSYSMVFFHAYSFEIQYVNRDLKRLKQRVGALTHRLHRLEEKKENLQKGIIPSVFGAKKLLKKRHSVSTSKQKREWKNEWNEKRNKHLRISGRKDAKSGNFVFTYEESTHTLHMTLPSGTPLVFHHVTFPYGQEHVNEAVEKQRNCRDKKAFGKPIAWALEDHGSYYLIKAIIEREENPHVNYSTSDGVIGIDCNVDHLAWSNLTKDGNRLESGILTFKVAGKRSGYITKEIERVAIAMIDYAKAQHKPIVVEKLNTTKAKTGNRYGNKKANRMSSLFAYRKLYASLTSRAEKEGVGVFTVNPAYTSVIGKFKYMRTHGLSVHEAASYVIGRRIYRYKEKVPSLLFEQVDGNTKEKHHWSQWHCLNRKFDLATWKLRTLYNLHHPKDGFDTTHCDENEVNKLKKVISL